jgi:muconolactone delta-isomerase
LNGTLAAYGTAPVDLPQLRRKHQDEVHDQLERTAARFADGARECPKANSGSVQPPWKAPANFKIESFVIRVGDWGGYMLMDCDDPLEVHKFCSMLPALNSRRDALFLSPTQFESN